MMETLHGEEKIFLWLDSFPLERQEKHKLLKRAGNAKRLLTDTEQIFSSVFPEQKREILCSMKKSLTDGGEYFRAYTEKLSARGLIPIPYPSDRYPRAFKALSSPPLVLYAKGKLSLLQTRLFCVVGSRRTSETVMKIGESISKDLSSVFTIVTGTADGGDYAATRGALKGSKNVICVAAGGYDAVPKTNDLLRQAEKYGLLLTAQPFFVPVRNFSYSERNELLAVLSEGALVLSAGEKSGALITAELVKKQKKPIFALPYSPEAYTGKGCNALIKNGAYLTESAADVFEKTGIERIEPTEKEIPLTETERKIYSLLQTETEISASLLSEKTGLPAYLLGGALVSLEVKGLIVRTGGNNISVLR